MVRCPCFLPIAFVMLASSAPGRAAPFDEARTEFLSTHCFDCHDATAEGGFDLSATPFELDDRVRFDTWVKVYDKVARGEMPPEDYGRPTREESQKFLDGLSHALVAADQKHASQHGRAMVRRLNRYEYENSLRELLRAPQLMVAQRLPADGLRHRYSKSGEALDVSHVQMEKFLELGEEALRTAVNGAAYRPQTSRYDARQQELMLRYLVAPTVRATVQLINGWEVEKEIILGTQPRTAFGKSEIQEKEAMAVFVGSRNDATRVDFTKLHLPITGRYIARVKSYTVEAAANGYAGGRGFEESGRREVYFPDKREIRPTDRNEPIVLYAMRPSGDSRWLTAFDAHPQPQVVGQEVVLEAGDEIRLDPARLVRYEADWAGNPNQTSDAIPGWAVQWIEVEGPLAESWPPPSYQAVFGDLPFEVADGQVQAISETPDQDAERLLTDFAHRN